MSSQHPGLSSTSSPQHQILRQQHERELSSEMSTESVGVDVLAYGEAINVDDQHHIRQSPSNFLNGISSTTTTSTTTAIDDKNNEFLCPICFDMIKDAHMTHCGHSFCHECIARSVAQFQRCPKCSTSITSAEHIFPNHLLNELITKHKTKIHLQSCYGMHLGNVENIDGLKEFLANESKKLTLPDVNIMLEILNQRKQLLESESNLAQNRLLYDFLRHLLNKKEEQQIQIQKEINLVRKDLECVENILRNGKNTNSDFFSKIVANQAAINKKGQIIIGRQDGSSDGGRISRQDGSNEGRASQQSGRTSQAEDNVDGLQGENAAPPPPPPPPPPLPMTASSSSRNVNIGGNNIIRIPITVDNSLVIGGGRLPPQQGGTTSVTTTVTTSVTTANIASVIPSSTTNLPPSALNFLSRKRRMLTHFDDIVSSYFHARRHELISDFDNRMDTNDRLKRSNTNGLEIFRENLVKFSRYSGVRPLATMHYSSDLHISSTIVSSIEFDKDNEYIAIGGVTKRIKIYDYLSVLRDAVDIHYPCVEMVSNSKISCIAWNHHQKNLLASSDYDGAVNLWDVATAKRIKSLHEHEKRCWSVDFNEVYSKLIVSGSDDSYVKIWSTTEPNSIASLEAKANVCCVKFNPKSSCHLAFGSADHDVHYYDIRNLSKAVCIFKGHKKAVSYVKFLNAYEIISASTDSQLKLWNTLSQPYCLRSFTGHINEKNFVGLATDGDYISCGSEDNSLYVYYKGLSKHLFKYKIDVGHRESDLERSNDVNEFVSAVCWRKQCNVILAANSRGLIKMLELV